MTAWDDELDRFEQCLADQRRAVREGRPDDVTTFVPAVEGPLPAEVLGRARALSAQAEALSAELGEATATVARQLQSLSSPARTHAGASFVDVRG